MLSPSTHISQTYFQMAPLPIDFTHPFLDNSNVAICTKPRVKLVVQPQGLPVDRLPGKCGRCVMKSAEQGERDRGRERNKQMDIHIDIQIEIERGRNK